MKIFIILLKKEFIELFSNKKLLSYIFFIALALFATRFIDGFLLANTIVIVLIMLIVNQYMFDSCVNDINSGGALFLHNIHAGFFKGFIAKLLCSLAIGVFLFLLCVFALNCDIHSTDLLWVLPCFIFISAFTFLLTIYTQKSDIFNIIISALICYGSLIAVIGIENLFARAIIILIASLLLLILCKVSYIKLSYRILL